MPSSLTPSLVAGRDGTAYQSTVVLLNLQIPGFVFFFSLSLLIYSFGTLLEGLQPVARGLCLNKCLLSLPNFS